MEKTTKLAPIRIDALVSAMPDKRDVGRVGRDKEVVDLLREFVTGVAGPQTDRFLTRLCVNHDHPPPFARIG